MASLTARSRIALDYGIAARAMPGEAACGDLAIVTEHAHGYLLAAMDGVGHGDEAAAAVQIAAAVLRTHAGMPVATLVQRCHEALRATRGVAMSVVSIDAALYQMSWIGVGNVQGFLLHNGSCARRRTDVLLQRSGLVGCSLPALQATTLTLQDGDVLGLATDGVRESFVEGVIEPGPPRLAAERALATLGRITDDALVIVVHIAVLLR